MHAQVEAPTPKWYTCDFGCGFGGDLASVNEHENACGRNRASTTVQSMGSARQAAAQKPMHSGAPLKKHQRSVRQGYVRVVCVPARSCVPLSYAAATKLSFGLQAKAGHCLSLLPPWPKRIAARAASQRLPRPFWPRQRRPSGLERRKCAENGVSHAAAT